MSQTELRAGLNRDLRPPAALVLLALGVFTAWLSLQRFLQFQTLNRLDLERTPPAALWHRAAVIQGSGLIVAAAFLLLAISACILTLDWRGPVQPARQRANSFAQFIHPLLLGAALFTFGWMVAVGNWPLGWYLQPPVGLAFVMLVLSASGLYWSQQPGLSGWQTRLAAYAPLVHLALVVFAGWCVYGRTLGLVVDVIK